MSGRTAENTLFELALYLVCCSRLALEENVGLGSFRLLEGAARLIAATGELGVPLDPFLAGELPAIESDKLQVMWDMERYTASLEEIQSRFVGEARRRNIAIDTEIAS